MSCDFHEVSFPSRIKILELIKSGKNSNALKEIFEVETGYLSLSFIKRHKAYLEDTELYDDAIIVAYEIAKDAFECASNKPSLENLNNLSFILFCYCEYEKSSTCFN